MRVARRGRALALALAVLVLSACGPRSQETLLPERYVDPPEVSEAAAAAYGEKAVEAYEEVADFLLEHSTDEELVHPDRGTPTEAELTDDVVAMMTPGAAQAWGAWVRADLAGDTQARDVVRLLRFHTWDSDVTAPRVGTVVRSQAVTDGTVDVLEGSGAATAATASPQDAPSTGAGSTGPGLEVSLTHTARLQLVEDDVPVDVELERPLVLTLVRTGDGWLIDSFEGTLRVPSDLPGDRTGPPEDTSSTTSPGR